MRLILLWSPALFFYGLPAGLLTCAMCGLIRRYRDKAQRKRRSESAVWRRAAQRHAARDASRTIPVQMCDSQRVIHIPVEQMPNHLFEPVTPN